jgi:hypothetical protein
MDCADKTLLPFTSRWPRMKIRFRVRWVSMPWAMMKSLHFAADGPNFLCEKAYLVCAVQSAVALSQAQANHFSSLPPFVK